MDPDLVRQQEEAEREAMGLAGRKPETPAPLAAAAILQAIAASAIQGSNSILSGNAGPAPYRAQQAGRDSEGTTPAPGLAGATGAGTGAAPYDRPQPGRYTARSLAWYSGQFLSFALAGAMLGGGLAIAAANYTQLSVEAAKIALFGSAGFFALVCAFASLFTGKPDQPRASSGT